MPTVTINASPRNELGKGAARKIRAAGQLPAIVYRAGDAATSIMLDPHELEQAFAKTNNRNTLVDLQMEGNSRLCLVRSTQRDPVSQLLNHVDFYEVRDEDAVTVQVPVTVTGEAQGIVMGGVLKIIRRSLDVTCLPGDIPECIELDISALGMDEFIRVSSVAAPKGCTILAPNDYNVVGVVGRRVALELEEVEVAEGEEGAEGAEGEEGEEDSGE